MPGSVTIRPFAERDLDAMLALRSGCFDGLDVERERIRHRWAYDGNPARIPGAPYTWIAECDGTIVGTFGMMPLRVFVDGVPEPSICAMDFCVDASMRGQGVGKRLADALIRTAGSRFRFATSPTAIVTALMHKQGVSVLDAGKEGALFAKGAPFDASPTPSGLEVRALESFGPACDALAARLAPHYRFVTVRDASYLTWRYLHDPYIRHAAFGALGADGTLRGLAVLTESPTEPQGYLAELIVEPDDLDAGRALLGGLDAAAAARGLQAVFALERRATIRALLAESGYGTIPEGAPAPFLMLLDGEADPKDWLLTPGDGDFLFRIGNAG